MFAVDLIRQVRDREPLAGGALAAFVRGVVEGAIPDYQVTAFLMAVFLNGIDDAAVVDLTLAMRDCGDVIDLSQVPGVKVDKHSTGGVGDKISLALAPLVAACGVAVPMVSGRGLGHTGGTLDKLEAIAGLRVDLSVERFRHLVAEHGVCFMGQTSRLAPADRKFYALRDVTATVESIPLITSSILAKKLAEGIDALVLDVKVGRGAFMRDLAAARQLAHSLVRVGRGAGIKVEALLTRMDEPLGLTIGNALEVREAIDILRGFGPADTTELTLALGARMLCAAQVARDEASALEQLRAAISSGRALEKFKNVVAAQGGDVSVIEEPQRLARATFQKDVVAWRDGFVGPVDSYGLGTAAMRLGAGRRRAEDSIDHAAGIEVRVRRGAWVRCGEALACAHYNDPQGAAVLPEIAAAFTLEESAHGAPPPLILERIDQSAQAASA